MKILLTGSAGMVGKNISDLKPKNVEILEPTIKELDLLDFGKVNDYVLKTKPEIIIHAAGIVGGIQANIKHPLKFLRENTIMGHNIIWAAALNSVRFFINLGSSCMYPKNINEPLKENMILTGELEPTNEGYAIAKIFTQRLCSYINRENHSSNFKTLVPCNLYGKHDKFDDEWGHMIPSVIRKLLQAKINNDESVKIWGDGTARREYMYASDFAGCIWYIIDHLDDIPELINVGLGYDYSINEYYEIIAKVVGFNGQFTHDLSKPSGMKRKLVDIDKLSKIGWEPSYTIEQGLKETFKFYIENAVI
ncbi:MAG: GDP-L-fucose synthase [Bacteroidales bacterium]|jgi:GDP-L-fucose synthase